VSLSAADPPAADPSPPTSATSATAEKFAAWLATRRVSARTRATYAERAGRFLGWLDDDAASVEGDPLADSDAFDRRRPGPARLPAHRGQGGAGDCARLPGRAGGAGGVPGARAAGRGSGRPAGARSPRPGRGRGPPAAARRPSDRLDPGPGRAPLALLSATGLRLAEAAALDVDDVPTAERTGAVHVRAGKRERPRTVPLPTDARRLLRRWLTERARHPAARRGEPAL